MKKKRYSVAASVVAAALMFSAFVVPASAAATASCTINGQTFTVPSASKPKIIPMEQSTVANANFSAPEKLSVTASDGKKLTVNTIKPYASGKAVYSIYALGSVNSVVNVCNGSEKLFAIQITPRPFHSDTTMAVKVAVDGTYSFCITPDRASDAVTFYTTDGSVFDTFATGTKTQGGKIAYYFKFKGKKAGSAGVYVVVGKQAYRVFTATAAGAAHTNPSTGGAQGLVIASDALNLRAEPNGSVIGSLASGEKVTVLQDSVGGWLKVKSASGQVGYCSSQYIQLESTKPDTADDKKPVTSQTATVTLSSGYLNMHSAPSQGSSVIGQLANHQVVTVLDCENGWTYVQTTDGVKGYCSSDYLVTNSNSGAVVDNCAGKTLSGLPSYKQKDAEWANTYIGGSNGGTIGSIGCAVTSLAMSESYRTGKRITPNDIKSQCQFTDGGGLYWPQQYSIMSGVNDTNLTKIYQQLKVDKPVIVGGMNSITTHWVIIKGYKNVPLDASGNPASLDASMFLVNDPGYDNCTLADYINQFPSGRVYRTY